MKHYKTVVVPETKRQVIDRVTCDMCGEVIEKEEYMVDKVVIQYKTGSDYPEGGSGEVVGADICPNCWKTEVVPWLESKVGKLRTTEWDWG